MFYSASCDSKWYILYLINAGKRSLGPKYFFKPADWDSVLMAFKTAYKLVVGRRARALATTNEAC